MLGEPGALLGAIQSPEQKALRPQLDALLAVEVGVVDHVMDQVGAKLIGSYSMLTEALRRRRVQTAEADRFVERMLGLELTQATYDRGAAFVDGVVERAGEEGLSPVQRVYRRSKSRLVCWLNWRQKRAKNACDCRRFGTSPRATSRRLAK